VEHCQDPSLFSFLFTLKNPHGLSHQTFEMASDQRGIAIYRSEALGPCFAGNLQIYDNCAASMRSFTGFETQGNACTKESGMNFGSPFTGVPNVLVREIEVFEIGRLPVPLPASPDWPEVALPPEIRSAALALLDHFQEQSWGQGQSQDDDRDEDDQGDDQDDDQGDEEVETSPVPSDPTRRVWMIRQGTGATVLDNMMGNDFRRGTGTNTILTISGNDICEHGRVVLIVRGNEIRESVAARPLFVVRGNEIRDGAGSKILFRIRGKTIYEGGWARFNIVGDPLSVHQLAALLHAMQYKGGSTSRPGTGPSSTWVIRNHTSTLLTISGDTVTGPSRSTVATISGTRISDKSRRTIITVSGTNIQGAHHTTIATVSGSSVSDPSRKTICSYSTSKISGGGKNLTVSGGPLSTVQLAAVLYGLGLLKV
jgi:hypothetical protein